MTTSRESPPVRVLVIDDYPALRYGVARCLEASPDADIRVSGSVAGYQEALAWLRQADADVIILDPWRPRGGGIEGLTRLLSVSQGSLLIFTATPEEERNERAVRAGARGVLGKAAALDSLVSAVAHLAQGELWLGREAMGRIFTQLTHGGEADESGGGEVPQLTRREREVVVACIEQAGATGRQLAASLHISEHTLRNHLTSIYAKLGVSNRLELYAYAQRNRLTRPTKE